MTKEAEKRRQAAAAARCRDQCRGRFLRYMSVLLGLLVIGGMILAMARRHHDAFTIYVLWSALVLLLMIYPLYRLAHGPHRRWQVLCRALLVLLVVGVPSFYVTVFYLLFSTR